MSEILLNGRIARDLGIAFIENGYFGNGTAAAPSISFENDTDTGFYNGAAGQLGFSSNGSQSLWFAGGGRLYGSGVEAYVEMPSGGGVNLVAAGTNQNITLTPSGTGNVVIGNIILTPSGPNVQGNAGTATFGNTANAATVFTTNATARGRFSAAGNLLLGGLTTDGTGVLQFPAATTSAGGIAFGTDVFVYRTGVSSLTIDGGLTLLNGSMNVPAVNSFRWTARSFMTSPADGQILIQNSAGTDFTRLQFGGTTSGFPCIKRLSAALSFRVADDSADADIYTKTVTASGYYAMSTVSWRQGTGSPEGVLTAPIGSLYSRTDGGAVTSFYVKESGTGNTGWVAK